MKAPILYLLAGILIGSLLTGVFYRQPEPSGDLKEQITRLQAREDSLTMAITVTRDSLETAFIVMENAKRDAEIANANTQKLRQQHEKILFVPTIRDSQRDSILSELYPSFNPVR